MSDDSFAPIFEELGFSEEDRHLVSPFFTNIDRSVYGITFLPPELIGALCSRASRAKDDLRQAFLKEFIKPSLFLNEEELVLKDPAKQDEIRNYGESLKALIEFLHKHPAERIFSNIKARDFYIKWLAQFGDDSIAQMAGAHLVYTGISQLAIKQIEDMRLGIAPIEKSTRYVDYSSKVNGGYRYYTDPTLESMGLLPEYKSAMDNLFETYTMILEKYQAFLKTKHSEEDERTLRTKAFDTARLLLPVSTLSQLALFANGQAFEYMINRGLDHKLGEIRWSSQRALEELNKVIPAFLRRLETDDSKTYRGYMSGRGQKVQSALQNVGFGRHEFTNQPPVKLLEYDLEGEDKIIAGLIYPETHEPFDLVLGKVKKLSTAQKESMLQEVLAGRKAKYYKIPRAFENIYVRFEILMNIGAWRDLHRHRTQTQMRQRFIIENGFDVPEGLKEAGLDGAYIAATKQAEEVFKKIEKIDADLAQYCCTLGHRVRFMQYQNMRAFFWEAELRTTSQGHPDYRKIEQEKARQIQRIYPLISKYLMVDMNDYDFARRGDTKKIESKEAELKAYLNK
jgi:thymidylate synthase ThyX